MNTELIKEAAVKYNDSELLRLAQEIEKEAGLFTLREGVEGLTRQLAPKASNVLTKEVGEVVKENASGLLNKVKGLIKPKEITPIIPKKALRTETGALVQNLMSKHAMIKESGLVLDAIKNVGKAIKQSVSSGAGRLKQKVRGLKTGFKHGDIADYALAQNKQVKKKGETILNLKTRLKADAKKQRHLRAVERIEKLKERKKGNVKWIVGLAAGTGIGAGSVALYNKKKNYYV